MKCDKFPRISNILTLQKSALDTKTHWQKSCMTLHLLVPHQHTDITAVYGTRLYYFSCFRDEIVSYYVHKIRTIPKLFLEHSLQNVCTVLMFVFILE